MTATLAIAVVLALAAGVIIGRLMRRGAPPARAPSAPSALSDGGDAQVVLMDCGEHKIGVIKQLRDVRPGLGLAEAKAFVENPPGVIAEGLSAARAAALKAAFEQLGATVRISGGGPAPAAAQAPPAPPIVS